MRKVLAVAKAAASVALRDGGTLAYIRRRRGPDLPSGRDTRREPLVRCRHSSPCQRYSVQAPGYPSHKEYQIGYQDLPQCNAPHPCRDLRRRAKTDARLWRPWRAAKPSALGRTWRRRPVISSLPGKGVPLCRPSTVRATAPASIEVRAVHSLDPRLALTSSFLHTSAILMYFVSIPHSYSQHSRHDQREADLQCRRRGKPTERRRA